MDAPPVRRHTPYGRSNPHITLLDCLAYQGPGNLPNAQEPRRLEIAPLSGPALRRLLIRTLDEFLANADDNEGV